MQDMLYTVKEVAELLKTNVDYVYKLKNAGLLRFIKLGSLKCRKTTLEAFLQKYDGYDLSDTSHIKLMESEDAENESN